MTAATSTPSLKKSSKAAKSVNALIELEDEIVQLASLGDAQIRAVFRKSHKQSGLSAAAKRVFHLSDTFKRIAKALDAKAAEDLLGKARGEALDVRARLVATEAVVPSVKIIAQLGITRQALSKAVLAHRMFYLEVGGENYYPAFYADAHLERRQLERVAKRLGELSGAQKWQFFTTPKASLNKLTPLEALRKGQYASVLTAAAGFAER